MKCLSDIRFCLVILCMVYDKKDLLSIMSTGNIVPIYILDLMVMRQHVTGGQGIGSVAYDIK